MPLLRGTFNPHAHNKSKKKDMFCGDRTPSLSREGWEWSFNYQLSIINFIILYVRR